MGEEPTSTLRRAEVDPRVVVRRIFTGAGAIYDELVEVATAGHDRLWKEAVLCALGSPRRVLDLACGTGILTFLIRDRFPACEVVGVDLMDEYLSVARSRAEMREDRMVSFLWGPAEETRWSGTFDAVTSCYLPKYADLPRLVPRLFESLVAGGAFVMQDFAYPRSKPVQTIWWRRFAELVSWARVSRPEAVQMMELLPDVIRDSSWTRTLPAELARAGFVDVRVEPLSMGTAAIVSARKPGPHAASS